MIRLIGFERRSNQPNPLLQPLISLFALMLVMGNIAKAQDSTPAILPFIQTSFSQKEHDFDKLLDQNLSFYMVHFGTGFAHEQFYLGINGAWSIDEASVSEEEETGEADRQDYDLTLGYNLNEHLTVFGGYKFGRTEIDFSPRDLEEEGVISFQDSYEEKGPYIGISWQHHMDETGILAVSFAYAWLDATNQLGKKPDDEEEELVEFDDFSGKLESDATGFSIGVRWSIPLQDQIVYFAGIKIQQYDQDLKQEGVNVSISERFTDFSMGLTYFF